MGRLAIAIFVLTLSAACAASSGDLAPTRAPALLPLPSSSVDPSASTPTVETADPTPGRMPRPPASARKARVVHVTDGDTVVLRGIDHGEIHAATGGRKSRLIGVDTPEVFGGAECYGSAASAFTRAALDGEQVLIDFDVDKTDRYGRALVYIWQRDGTFFNARLVLEGFALQMTVPPNVRYAEMFTTLARRAREADRGLWSGCPL